MNNEITITIKSGKDLSKLIDVLKGFDEKPAEETDVIWVDLGLPSGTLWADRNAEGYYSYDEAKEKFGNSLPSGRQMAELIECCKCEWDEQKKGLKITGKNGNYILIPAKGYKYKNTGDVVDQEYGFYWTSMPSSYSAAYAYYLHFYSGGVYPLNYNYRAYGFPVRPCRESY